MEAENDEATIKRHDNPSTLHNIILTVQVSAFLAVVGYACYPTIITLRQAVSDWFDWFRLILGNLFFIFLFLNALIGLIYYFLCKTTEKKKPDLYDEYIAAVPSVVRSSPGPAFAPMEVGDCGGGYYNNSGYPEIVPPFQEVNTVEESHCYDRVVMETNSKSSRRTRSEKKLRSTLEYRRTGSERLMKTASWGSQAMDELSSEEFRMTVETFIMKTKKIHYMQKGVPQLQNGGVDQWQNGFPQLENSFVDQRHKGVPQLQNGGVDPWQTVVPQWQGQPDYGGTSRHRHPSRRLVGGSGSTGSGPYLAISNYTEAAIM